MGGDPLPQEPREGGTRISNPHKSHIGAGAWCVLQDIINAGVTVNPGVTLSNPEVTLSFQGWHCQSRGETVNLGVALSMQG